jgi:hypothetical protein
MSLLALLEGKRVSYHAGRLWRRIFQRSPQHRRVDFEYHRIIKSAKHAHHPTIVTIPTSDGSGQACHPDVIYAPNGFGPQGFKYWMVCTPYPFGDSSFENPEIFGSHDGVAWTPPPGVRNPLVAKPDGELDHNSDPDLLLHDSELRLYYRETLRTSNPARSRILVITSRDGLLWSPPHEVLRDDRQSHLVSPAVLHDGARFHMWAVELLADQLKVTYRESLDGRSWCVTPRVATIGGLPTDRHPWHLDVIRDKDGFSALLVSCTAFGGRGSRLHYAYSRDGIHWDVKPFLLEQVYPFESRLQYRATLCARGNHLGEYDCWYSAAGPNDRFSIAYLRLQRQGDRLVPVDLPGLSETLTAPK